VTGPSRADRIADQIRAELGDLLMREVRDPGLGFVTLTYVRVTPDLQLARVYYTALGDAEALKQTGKALARATPFLRSQIGRRIRLRRVPELQFFFDDTIQRQHRIEELLEEIRRNEAQASTGGDQHDGTNESES
jgi:ribosome-binding factor A